MPAYKDTKKKSKNKWYASFYYTSWDGKRLRKTKRGFANRSAALDYEESFLNKNSPNAEIKFKDFVEIYRNDMMYGIRQNTWQSKNYIIDKKILPYFGEKRFCEISKADIKKWQNVILSQRKENGEPYKPEYLRSIHNQLSAIFNYAIKIYDLGDNPAAKVGNMGHKTQEEMLFWTKEEYMKFIQTMMDKPYSFYAFELLYWCGLREGELLALTPNNFDLEENTLRINSSYQRIKREDIITPPKTESSKRTIFIPQFICDEMQELFTSTYGLDADERIFTFTKSYLQHEMKRGCQQSGVKKIRIHDLRHSHVSLLIDKGFSAVDIAKRMGHENIYVTLHYAHMFSSKHREMAEKLDIERNGDVYNVY